MLTGSRIEVTTLLRDNTHVLILIMMGIIHVRILIIITAMDVVKT